MARPLFSDMLYDRRRQLGLSIKQASNVLRLKEEVLVAFEEGDFDSIPKSGYAQGMLSSYARYLGLNAKTVVNQFSTDLFEHEKGAGSHEARRRSRHNRDADDGPLYEVPQAAAMRSGRPYVESRGFLPTSGGYAGDMGDFATTSSARPRYRSTSSSGSEGDDAYPQGRPYTTRVPMGSSPSVTPLGQSQRQRPIGQTGTYVPQDTYGRTGRHYEGAYGSRDDVTTRRVMPSQYRDDLLLDNDGGGYETASSVSGRRSSRNIASTRRPNVQRRSSRSTRTQLRNRSGNTSSGGVLGSLQGMLQGGQGPLLAIVVLLCLILTAIIIFSFRSCVGGQQSNGGAVGVTTQNTNTTGDESTDETEDEGGSMTKEEEEQARAEAAAAKAAETENSVAERTFEVNVGKGETTWLEIEYDGISDVAETITGPWNRTYTVRQSISINVNDPSAVTVTEGGKKLEFESKASGIGSINIQVSKKTDATADAATTGEAADGTQQTADGQQPAQNQTTTGEQGDSTVVQDGTAATPETTGQQGTTQPVSQEGTATAPQNFEGYTLDADGYYYGADGYYDAAGNFYQY